MIDELIAEVENDCTPPDDGEGQPHAIGEVLAELFAQYETRFPEVNVTLVEA